MTKNLYLPNNLQEWLNYLENRHPCEIHLGLSRIQQIAAKLNLLSPKAKVISVAGTNGKGSTVATLESIYLAHGFNVGSYTSPHLLNFNERIKINQKSISSQSLVTAFNLIEKTREKIWLSYFEITTLAALWYFSLHSLDLIILEVGMGGRLDATNIIDADLAIITTIDFDHEEFLGNTKEAIGYEKAGILRSNHPCIYADIKATQSIIARANAINAKIYHYNIDYSYFHKHPNMIFSTQDLSFKLPKSFISPKAIAAAIMATICLRSDLPIQLSSLREGIKDIKLNGRLQIIRNKASLLQTYSPNKICSPLTQSYYSIPLKPYALLFDVSHNPQSVHRLRKFILKYRKGKSIKKIYAVFSALQDKDLPNLIAPLVSIIERFYISPLDHKRTANIQQLSQSFVEQQKNIKINFSIYDNIINAYQDACQHARSNDLIVVYGSFITVSSILISMIHSKDRHAIFA